MVKERYRPTDGANANPCSRCGVRTALRPLTICLSCYRQLGHYTQQQLADRLRVPANTLARWERGDLEIAHPTIFALALTQIQADR